MSPAQKAKAALAYLLPCAPGVWTWKDVGSDLARAVLLLVLGLLLLANLLVAGELVFRGRDPLIVDTGYDFRTAQEFRAAIRHHGIEGTAQIWNPEKRRWEFERDGKQCPLFAYLKQERR